MCDFFDDLKLWISDVWSILRTKLKVNPIIFMLVGESEPFNA